MPPSALRGGRDEGQTALARASGMFGGKDTIMDYSRVSDSDLLKRYRRLEANTSAMTMEQEFARQAALDAMALELLRRDRLQNADTVEG
jgi:hypothetical protein